MVPWRKLVRTAGIEPARDYSQRIFIPLRLSPPRTIKLRVCGLDYPFTMAFAHRCRPSSLYTFPESGLGSGLAPVPSTKSVPRIWAVLHPAFPTGALKSSSPLRLPVPPRPLVTAYRVKCVAPQGESCHQVPAPSRRPDTLARRTLIAAASRFVLMWAA